MGKLYIVATPLGNLADISQRALNILNSVDKIAAEDTRHSKRLLQHYSITKPLVALHAHNEQEQSKALIADLQQGMDIALISDAGTPLISDPGYNLVQLAHQYGISVSPIPGPCAAIAALSALGLPCNQFSFLGFLPVKSFQRLQELEQHKIDSNTLVFYEAPHRILATLNDCITIFGAERIAGIARELTKTFETIRVGKLAELLHWIKSDKEQQLGEFVLVIKGVDMTAEKSSITEITKILKILLAELPLKQAVKLCSEITGEAKNAVYQMALELQKMV